MTTHLIKHPTLLSLLDSCRAEPHDDAPRLVLADWLEDHGEAQRAEFIRKQLLLAPGSVLDAEQKKESERRCRALLDRHGGCWLLSLWRWFPAATNWHRGLLTLRIPRRYEVSAIEEMTGWIDALQFRLTGRQSLCRAMALLCRCAVNHVTLDFRNWLSEQTLLEELSEVAEQPNLRTLSIEWPLRMLRSSEGNNPRPTISPGFLRQLLSLPLAKRLRYLGSSWPFALEQSEAIRRLCVEPVHATHSLWMHGLLPSCFRDPL